MNKNCSFCGNVLPTIGTIYKFKDGGGCSKCIKEHRKVLPIFTKKITVSEALDLIDPSRVNFRNHGYIESANFGKVKIDDTALMIYLPNSDDQVIQNQTLFPLSQVYKIEIIEDNQTVSSGGLGAAVVGDVLAGGVGSIVGSNVGKKKTRGTCAKLSIKIYLDNPITQFKEIYFVNEPKKPILKDSQIYIDAYQSISRLEAILQYYIRKHN